MKRQAPRHGPRSPSPRVRGSPTCHSAIAGPIGSIPARAGEPAPHALAMNLQRVHPRACGGAFQCAVAHNVDVGPSPRVRGSLHRCIPLRARGGSIPARAGEPRTCFPQSAGAWVHPRACGGAKLAPSSTQPSEGPSPRVRGSLRCDGDRGVWLGSIPARAGEPDSGIRRPVRARVHPRACGGAVTMRTNLAPVSGPSPRVRGSQAEGPHYRRVPGSIPARAGEPFGCAFRYA
ncbi:MAG: hypothetical protein JWM95_5601 [Gemmatimonadetes bacterium]|nr:hypothetical protein [Gemmatimonadota bacterium]